MMVNRESEEDDILPMGKAFPNAEVIVMDEEDKLITERNKENCVYQEVILCSWDITNRERKLRKHTYRIQ